MDADALRLVFPGATDDDLVEWDRRFGPLVAQRYGVGAALLPATVAAVDAASSTITAEPDDEGGALMFLPQSDMIPKPGDRVLVGLVPPDGPAIVSVIP